ncbi:hypothetical protein V6R21_29675 [Limibacter armeniacum]|uniref:hypothetical protein n=1 Tax=Limibacter armeniacum TaxID=466084 RepID=UPI002FE5EAE7
MKQKRKTILVIQREVSILQIIELYLSERYDLFLTQSENEAILWMLNGGAPDLIISDSFSVSEGDSYSLKSNNVYFDSVPVIALGADNVQEVNAEIKAIIDKPFNPVNFTEKISSYLIA